MGQLFDDFSKLSFQNEAEVSQNFLVPLLQRYLGYDLTEIIPEQQFPAKTLYSGVHFNETGTKGLSHRPDYIVCLNGDENDVKFIIDSKGPDENIDEHFGQLKSYSNSVGKNFLMMTNGKALRVFNANDLVFNSDDIAELQVKLPQLLQLLGKTNQSLKSPIEILKDFDYNRSVNVAAIDSELTKKKVILADFQKYLNAIHAQYKSWHLPNIEFPALGNIDIQKIDPQYLLTFKQYSLIKNKTENTDSFKFQYIESKFTLKARIFIGETGIGKTTFLKFLAYRATLNCLNFTSTCIPVYISLREIGHRASLTELIVSALGQNGYYCQSVHQMFEKNEFVFFLDGYDEIPEAYQTETAHAIEKLFSKCYCYITTRSNRIPSFKPAHLFEIQPISSDEIEYIVKLYLPDDHYTFNSQVAANELQSENANTLLLLLLISLYKEHRSLPKSVDNIIVEVVRRIKSWHDTKFRHLPNPISWETLAIFYSKFAFFIIESGKAAIDLADAEEIIVTELNRLENKRKIKSGITTTDILKHLTETGILLGNGDQFYFWHRLFLNYFAAEELKELFLQNPALVAKLKEGPEWEVVLISCSSRLDDNTIFLQQVVDQTWLAGFCLLENPNCEPKITERIVSDLINLTKSPILAIRMRALTYLGSLNNHLTQAFFFKVLDLDVFPDIKMVALTVIGKTGTPEAKEIIYRYLDWNEGDFFTGLSSQSNIVRALSYFGEEGYLQIIKNWEKYGGYPVSEVCKNIFIELHARGNLTAPVLEELKALFCRNYVDKNKSRDTSWYLSKIFIAIREESFAESLVKLLATHREVSKMEGIFDILKSYNSREITDLIYKTVFEKIDNYYGIEKLAKVILHSSFQVPKSIFQGLIEHPSKNVQLLGIEGLSRFEYDEVKEDITKQLDSTDEQIQARAFSVLVDNGEIIELVRNDSFPQRLYTASIHTIFEGVRKFDLTEATYFLKEVQDHLNIEERYVNDYNVTFDLIKTYLAIGEYDLADEVIGWYFDGHKFLQDDKILLQNFLNTSHEFDKETATAIADCFFKTYLTPNIKNDEDYQTDIFIQAAEAIQTDPLRLRIKEITDGYVSQIKSGHLEIRYHIERPLRALVKIGKPEDEQWIIEHITCFNHEGEPDIAHLSRAVECLASFGTLKSIATIQKVAKKNLKHNILINACQTAVDHIYRRANRMGNTHDLLLGQAS